jgi:hypothetical protein
MLYYEAREYYSGKKIEWGDDGSFLREVPVSKAV